MKPYKICICKKDFSSIFFDFNVVPIKQYSEVCFIKGEQYKYRNEDMSYDNLKSIWVVYNENGEEGHQGRRFYLNIDSKFSEYFDGERKIKLKKLKLISNEHIEGI